MDTDYNDTTDYIDYTDFTNTSSTTLSSSSTTTTGNDYLSPLLSTWYNVTKHVPIQHIIPIGLGNTHEMANHNAFFGDKRLTMEIALQLRRYYNNDSPSECDRHDATNKAEEVGDAPSFSSSSTSTSSNTTAVSPPTMQTVQKIQSMAGSNAFLHQHVRTILPYHMVTIPYGNLYHLIQSQSQIHDAGTMIEAVVDYIDSPNYNPNHNNRMHCNNDHPNRNDSNGETTEDDPRPLESLNGTTTAQTTTTFEPAMQQQAISELAQFLIQQATSTLQIPHPSSTSTDATMTEPIVLSHSTTSNTTTTTTKQEPTNDAIDANVNTTSNTSNISSSSSNRVVHGVDLKRQLQQKGGTVTTKKRIIPSNNDTTIPLFTSTAQIDDLSATIYHGRNATETERSAISMVWRYYSKRRMVTPSTVVDATTTTTTTTTTTNSTVGNNKSTTDDDDDIDIENPKGRMISIGGKITSEKLPGHPDHLPRFKATCLKPFLIQQQLISSSSTTKDDPPTTETLKYTIAATAEGRTKYEAERIASLIVWLHIMNMSTLPTTATIETPIPTVEVASKLVPYVTKDMDLASPKKSMTGDSSHKSSSDNVSDTCSNEIGSTTLTAKEEENQDWFDGMDERDPIFEQVILSPDSDDVKLSAKKRRQLRTLANRTVRHISTFDIRDTQDNFLNFKLTDHEQPFINLRPGGETIVESWYRGALNPLAAFHRP
jgi:hypothetical protein